MAIAQMNWGRMRFPLDDPRMEEFSASLEPIYKAAEMHEGFIWRISDEDAGRQLKLLGHDDRMSATISTWDNVEALHSYSYQTRHAEFLDRRREWFEIVEGPQLVIWSVDTEERPDFRQAFKRLNYLTEHGPTEYAYGWPKNFG